jgi:hypothetical protein
MRGAGTPPPELTSPPLRFGENMQRGFAAPRDRLHVAEHSCGGVPAPPRHAAKPQSSCSKSCGSFVVYSRTKEPRNCETEQVARCVVPLSCIAGQRNHGTRGVRRETFLGRGGRSCGSFRTGCVRKEPRNYRLAHAPKVAVPFGRYASVRNHGISTSCAGVPRCGFGKGIRSCSGRMFAKRRNAISCHARHRRAASPGAAPIGARQIRPEHDRIPRLVSGRSCSR